MTDFVGAAGDDFFVGGSGSDTFDLTQGGNDTARGGTGTSPDYFYLGGALNEGDKLAGGGGTDRLYLDGDYSFGLVLGPKTVTNIELWYLAAGHSYNITVDDATDRSLIYIHGEALGAGDSLIFDASAETASSYMMYDGAGDDVLIGGGGFDDFSLEQGGVDKVIGGDGVDNVNISNAALTRADRIDGGDGEDTLVLSGDYSAGFVFGAKTIRNFENFEVVSGNSYKLTLNDANVAAGSTLGVFGESLGALDSLKLDGSAETDGAFIMKGGEGRDRLTGGDGDDDLSGNGGRDTLVGGPGHDILHGNKGADIFVFTDGDSPFANPDLIADLEGKDTVNLTRIDADTTVDGDQAFTLASSFSGHAGELVLSYDSVAHVTSLLMDTNGDSTADIIIQATGNHLTFDHFLL